MKKDSPRIAVVGYGAIADKHIEVFRFLGAEIVAACNRSEAGRARAREQGGIARVYDDPLHMIDAERPDGVLITANVLSLFDIGCKVIPAGIPVLIEKPPGTSVAEVLELARLATTHSTPVMVGLNRRFYSVYHRALGAIGGREAVTGVSVEWSEEPARMQELGHPGGVIRKLNFANSLHGIDFLPFFGGEEVSGTAWGRDLGGGTCRWQMAFDGLSKNGSRLHFVSSWDVPGRWRLVVDAPDIRMVSAPLETATLLRRGKPAEEVAPSDEDRRFKPGFYGQAEFFLNVVKGDKALAWPACSFEDAFASMRIAEMLTNTCLGGARV